VRAVIFDLWDTLVVWPAEEDAGLRVRLEALLGVSAEELRRRLSESYRASMTGPLAEAYLAIGVPGTAMDAVVADRYSFARRVLRLRPGATGALAALRSRGIKLAVLSNCSEDVPAAWPATELAGLFDVETFSPEFGSMKPDPEIYVHTAAALGVDPRDCLFVGDGANDELAGASRVGMTPVLFLPHGATAPWPEVRGWRGLRVTSVEEVQQLC
jgi:putative hydrolase of the HAD superfamily